MHSFHFVRSFVVSFFRWFGWLVGLFLGSFARLFCSSFVVNLLVCSLVDYPFVRWIFCSLVHSFACKFVSLFRLFCSFVRSLARSFARSLVHWLVRSFVRPFVRSLARLSVRSFIRPFFAPSVSFSYLFAILFLNRSYVHSLVYFFPHSFVDFYVFSLFLFNSFFFSASLVQEVEYSHRYRKADTFKSLFTSFNPRLFLWTVFHNIEHL